MVSRGPLGEPKWVPKGTLEAKEVARWTLGAPEWHTHPFMIPRGPRGDPRRSQEDPRGPQDARKRSQGPFCTLYATLFEGTKSVANSGQDGTWTP